MRERNNNHCKGIVREFGDIIHKHQFTRGPGTLEVLNKWQPFMAVISTCQLPASSSSFNTRRASGEEYSWAQGLVNKGLRWGWVLLIFLGLVTQMKILNIKVWKDQTFPDHLFFLVPATAWSGGWGWREGERKTGMRTGGRGREGKDVFYFVAAIHESIPILLQ